MLEIQYHCHNQPISFRYHQDHHRSDTATTTNTPITTTRFASVAGISFFFAAIDYSLRGLACLCTTILLVHFFPSRSRSYSVSDRIKEFQTERIELSMMCPLALKETNRLSSSQMDFKKTQLLMNAFKSFLNKRVRWRCDFMRFDESVSERPTDQLINVGKGDL